MFTLWMWVLAPFLVVAGNIIYNIFFHPLRHFHGPRVAGATTWWKAYQEVWQKKTLAVELFELHSKYGDIVRVGPNELHFGKPSAFHDIYNSNNKWNKDKGLYTTPGVKTGTFVFPTYAESKERRLVLQPMFSKKAIQNIEGLVWKYADRLSSAMTRTNAKHSSVDMVYAFRSFTLDVIMSFTLGKSIEALDTPNFVDPLIVAMDTSLSALPVLRNFPLLRKITFAIPPFFFLKVLPLANGLTPRIYRVREIVNNQLDAVLQDPSRLDEAPHQTIFHRMLDEKVHNSGIVPDTDKLYDEGMTLIFAGSHTVADTMLMGHFHMLNQPELMARLKSEILTIWPDVDSPPSLQQLETLPLLTATIKESLRHMPIGVSLTRVVPHIGATISGQRIPGGTTVGMSFMHVHQNAEIFPDPLSFKPERWLGEDAGELENWLVAFSRGPRMCIAVNLAWCELYITFATMIRRFNMEIDGTTAEDMVWRECIAAYYPRRHLHAWCRPVESSDR
ncbi:cytochrome P450 [Xylariales sp. AK1849]|nr:cytochrome P450 [Xylariales sp. AK1849]